MTSVATLPLIIAMLSCLFAETAAYIIWKISTKNTLQSYLAKSFAKLFIYMMFAFTLVYGVVEWGLSGNLSEKIWTWILVAFYIFSGMHDLYRLSQDDEDDFFTKTSKKIRRRVGRMKEAYRKRRPAYITP